jgi:RNA polymerase sigma-70 factor, ECF subfamily
MNSENEKTFDPIKWVDNFGDYLYGFAYSRVRNEAAAEDLVQETLLSAIQSIKSFRENSSEKTWLCGILKHKIIDFYRKSSREVELTEEEADMSSYDYLFRDEGIWKGHWTAERGPVVWNESPHGILEKSEFRGVFVGCLSELPERIANVFTLREVDGYAAPEICEFLMISPSNFWVMMHRARLHLRRCVDNNWFSKEGKC